MFNVGDKVTFRSLDEFEGDSIQYEMIQFDLHKLTPSSKKKIYTIRYLDSVDGDTHRCAWFEETIDDLIGGPNLFYCVSLCKVAEIKLPEPNANDIWDKVKEILASPPKISYEDIDMHPVYDSDAIAVLNDPPLMPKIDLIRAKYEPKEFIISPKQKKTVDYLGIAIAVSAGN